MAERAKAILVFDGLCNFCSASVRFVLRNDTTGIIHFAPLQSAQGRVLMHRYGLNVDDAESFLFIMDGVCYTRSDAALQVAKHLGLWRWLGLLRLVPRSVRDWAYSYFASKRYQWFGKRQTCFLPNAEERSRFIDFVE